jgi:hypothetical protein
MGINAYQKIKQNTDSASQKNYQLFNSILLWVKDSINKDKISEKMECILNAQYLLTTTIERMPSNIPDEEAELLINMLLIINKKFNECIRNSDLISRESLVDELDALVFLRNIYQD